MGIRERQERDREAVRRAILDAARELFVAEGYQNVSIRKIAERIEYSPAAIYSYFSSKDDIFYALAEEGFRLLGGPQEAGPGSRLQGLPPLERIRAIFWRFYEFSCQHPQYFALMFVDRSVPRISREFERFRFARAIKQSILDEIQGCIESGDLPANLEPAAAMRALGAGLLGVAVTRVSDRLAPGEDPDKMASNILDLTLAGLKAGISLQPITTGACPLDDTVAAEETPVTVEEHR
ncbi:MAG TPA: TetR/AcrR family transcriptional regulator [Vicinamibacterales bacterium]|jgi:AcrR family transcriptional regulator